MKSANWSLCVRCQRGDWRRGAGRQVLTRRIGCSRAQLRVKFRFLRKNRPYWNGFYRNERLLRSKHGRAIPYQCLEMFGLGSEFFLRGFVRLTAYWSRLEKLRGCCVELPPVFIYRMRKLCDPESSWWIVAYMKLAAKTAAYILFEVDDSCRLWRLSREMIQDIRRLDLQTILGNTDNARECLSLINAIERSRFRQLPAE